MNIEEVSIEIAKTTYYGSHIGNDLLLFDNFGDVPISDIPRKMSCIFLGICVSGNAQYTMNTEKIAVGPNDAVIIGEGQVVDKISVSHDFRGFALMMSVDFFHEIIKGIHALSSLFIFSRRHPVLHLSSDEAQNALRYYNAFKHKVDKPDHRFRSEVVSALIKAMIYDLGNVIVHFWQKDKQSMRSETFFARFITLVERNFRRERRVKWYAAKLNITPRYLSESVKLVSGRTPIDWVNSYVIIEIRLLLKNTTMSIKDITQALNFPNQSYLGKFFKEQTGITPSDYRKS